jgi:hypothetical protein
MAEYINPFIVQLINELRDGRDEWLEIRGNTNESYNNALIILNNDFRGRHDQFIQGLSNEHSEDTANQRFLDFKPFTYIKTENSLQPTLIYEDPEIEQIVEPNGIPLENNTNNIIAEQNLATTIADQQVQVGQQRATALAAILLGLQQEQHGNGKKYKKSKKSKKSKKIKKSKKSKKTKKSKKSKK